MILKSPIEFPVNVNGNKLIASVEEDVSNPVQIVYKIRFSDGYVDEFCLDDEEDSVTGDNLEESMPYAFAIRNDITIVSSIEKDKLYYVFQDKIDEIETNIWVLEKESETGDIFYNVYYNSFYRFEVRNSNGEWIASSSSKID